MKAKLSTITLLLLFFSSAASASYLDMLMELDVSLLCILSWITAPVVAVLLVLGGYLLISGTSPEKRDKGKALIQNALVGLILVVLLIQVSIVIGNMEALYWSVCWGRAPPEPTPENQPPVAVISITSSTEESIIVYVEPLEPP